MSLFQKRLNTIGVSNSLGPDQARYFVGPDLDPDCLLRLSEGDNNCIGPVKQKF